MATGTWTDRRTEKQVVQAGDQLMAVLGFDAVRFSQARASKQTPGIPDRRYYHPARQLAVWWEAKTTTGRPSVAQLAFRAMCQACGEAYVLGTEEALITWLTTSGVIRRDGQGSATVAFGRKATTERP